MQEPQQQPTLNATPFQKKVIPLTGKWIPANEGTDLVFNFKQLTNLRYADTHPIGVGGMTKINAAVMNPTYLKPRNAFHFSKSQPAESHLLVQAFNAGLTASQVLQNKTAIPDTGPFEEDALWTDAAGADIGFFSLAPDETLIYCNSKENLIWGGDEARIGGFFIANPDSSVIYDYTDKVQNTMTDAQNVATMHVTGGGIDAYTMIVLHGENGATDSSGKGHDFTVSGTTYSTTAKFGTYAFSFNGSSDYIYCTDHADFDQSGGVWSIDTWFYYNSLNAVSTIWSLATDANNYNRLYVNTSGIVIYNLVISGSEKSTIASGIGSIQLGRWHHVEMAENGDSYCLFIDGVQVSNQSMADRPANYTSNLAIGAFCNGSTFAEFSPFLVDEFRMSAGVARHTTGFAPQASAYSASSSCTAYVIATRPLQGLKLYMGNANTAVASVASDYWTGSGFSLTAAPIDYMEYSSDALAQAAYVSSESSADITLDLMEYASDAAAQAAYVTSDLSLDLMEYSSDALAQAAYADDATRTADRCTGGTAYEDSNAGGLVGAYAFDGDTSTYWTSANKGVSGYAWVAYNFATARRITRVKIIGRAGFAELNFKAFGIYGSNDSANGADGTWTTLATGLNTSSSVQWDTFDFTNQTAFTWIKIYGPAQNYSGSYYIQVAEIEMSERVTRAYSESSTKVQGSYALKVIATATDSLNKTLTRTVSPTIDLTGIDTLKFAIRSTRTGSNIKLAVHDSGGTTTETTPNITSADTWQTVTWDLSAVANADKNAIDSIIITVVNADAENTFYIDGASSLLSYSEATAKTQGSYALKGIALITDSLNKTLTRTISSPIDLSGVETLYFDIRASRMGINLSLAIHDSGGTWTSISPNILAADAYQTVTWDISAVADADKNAIDQIRVTVDNASAENTFYIDNFYSSGPPVSLQSYSEATLFTQGLYSLKGVATITTSLNRTLTKTIASPIDLTGVSTIGFDIYSSRTGSNIKIGIHDSGGTTTEVTPNVTNAGAWQSVVWDVSAVADGDKNAIDRIIITIVNADAANTFYIDNFGPAGGALYDGTATAGGTKTLGQTGLISFGPTTSLAKPRMYNGLVGYLYRFTFTGIDAGTTVYHATVDAPIQPIVDLWDGVDRECMAFYVYKNGTYNDYTLNVYENEYDSTDDSSYVELDSLATGTNKLIFASYERLMGINIGLIGGHVNTTAATTMTISYSNDGANFVTVGTLDDGTSVGSVSLSQSGTVTWNPPASAGEFMSRISKVTPRYHYEITFNQTLSADVQVFYLSGIPVQRTFGQYRFPLMAQDMLFLCCDESGRKNTAIHSEYQTSQIFNGDNAGEIEFGETGELTCGASLYNLYGYNLYNLIIFFKDSEMWKLSGNFPHWQRHLVSDSIGCPAPMTLKTIGLPGDVPQGLSRNVIVWQGSQGVYVSDGRAALPIHADIANYFDSLRAECIKPSLIGSSWADIDLTKMEYHLHVASGSTATEPNTELVFDLKRWRWYEIDRGTGKQLVCGTSVRDTDGNYYNYGFIDTGYAERLENGTDFDGNDIVQTLWLGDLVLAENDFTVETRVERLQLVTVAKTISSNDIAYTHYVDTETTGTAFTMAPRATDKRIADIVLPVNSKTGVFHSGKFEMTTNNEPTGFEPLALAYIYSVQYEKAV